MISLRARFVRSLLMSQKKLHRLDRKIPSINRTRKIVDQLALFPKARGPEIKKEVIAGIPVDRILPPKVNNNKAMMYIHGGGYVSGSPRTHRTFTTQLALSLGCEVWVPDYRLAPEHPFPNGLEDCAKVWEAFCNANKSSKRILGGESAGGGLSLALCYFTRTNNLPMPDLLYLQSAWLDLQLKGDSYQYNADIDVFVHPYALEKGFAALYAGGQDRSNVLMSPILGDPTGLPPTYIQVCKEEVFYSDNQELYRKAKEAGVDISIEAADKLWHAWLLYIAIAPEAKVSLARLSSWVNSKV